MLKVIVLTLATTNICLADINFECLVKNVYYEARGEEEAGWAAVAKVTINRAQKYKKPVCAIVYEPRQFSWTSKKGRSKIKEEELYKEIKEFCRKFVRSPQAFLAVGESVLYFHKVGHAKPAWTKKMRRVARIGKHIFYEARD